MSVALRLVGTTNLGEVDSSGQQRAILYDASGNVIMPTNRAAVVETVGGVLNAGKDYKTARTLRASSIGTLRTTDNSLWFYDAFEGTTRSAVSWIETATTMTSAQALATGLTLNSGSTTTTSTGVLESTHRQFPFISRIGLAFRAHLRFQGATNCVEEWGFGDTSIATQQVMPNGAFFRRDAAGSLQPVLSFNSTETQGSTMTGPATTDYAWYEIFLEDGRATFQIFSAAGVLISAQVMEIGSSSGGAGVATQARMFAVTHLPAFVKVYNTGTAGTAPQIVVNHVTVQVVDMDASRDVRVQQSGMGFNSLISPTGGFASSVNYANSAAPTSATLSNTAAGYTTMGGQWQYAAVATSETDNALFVFTNPSPYTLYVTGIRIDGVNMGAAVGTTPSTIQWGAAFNSSATSLATAAPYDPKRVTLGYISWPVGAAIGAVCTNPINWFPGTPMAVFPGRLLHLIAKNVVGTATASQILRGTAVVDGFYE